MPAALKSDANPAKAAYDAARRFAMEGDFAAALERHEWFHSNALAHEPSYHGVRLSFALSAWMELGRKYPPALKSLKRIRDHDSDRLRSGVDSDSLFHDVVSINRSLNEAAETLMLFRHIEAARPETAQRLFRFIMEESMQAAPELFLRYTPDLTGHFQWMSEQHRSARKQIADSLALTTSTANNIRTQLMKFDACFLTSVQQLAQLAVDSDQAQVAASILSLADTLIQELQSPP